ncbi:MAG: chemotaxis protein MotB [Parvibaculaceae bacterium]|jgi:chemotaxis protein MotB|nr:flagellar motor protein MotB [Parvibaculaceae bacterium]
MSESTIIIKKVKKSGHAHHGGAWKIAYADFVTAMMAFFLLMWLISMTTPEQKQGLADYFAPASVSRSNSGAGGVMGGTAFDTEGARMSGSAPKVVMTMSTPSSPDNPKAKNEKAAEQSTVGAKSAPMDGAATTAAELQNKNPIETVQDIALRTAAESLRQALKDMPELAELSKNIMIEETDEGLNISLVDQEGRAMFPPGHAEPYERTRLMLQQVAKIIDPLPNRISITGHSDAAKMRGNNGYSKWELTADRANATRRILQGAGVPNDRLFEVTGKADIDPLFPEDPYLPSNRRISILLMREAPVIPPGFQP